VVRRTTRILPDMRRQFLVLAVAVLAVSGCGLVESADVPVPGLARLDGPWSPTPVQVPAAVLVAADQACRTSMQPFPVGVQIVVVDARGKSVIQLAYAGPNGAMAQCNDMTVDAQGRVEALGGGGFGQGGGEPPPVPPNTLESAGGMSSGDPATSSVAMGRAGPGIAGVGVLIPGQPPITASFANGWYLVWWPGAWPQGTVVAGFDQTGQKVAETAP
jgi:hypothetical protein